MQTNDFRSFRFGGSGRSRTAERRTRHDARAHRDS